MVNEQYILHYIRVVYKAMVIDCPNPNRLQVLNSEGISRLRTEAINRTNRLYHAR